MTTIRTKTQIASGSIAGSEAIPVETAGIGDGWVTIDQIAARSSLPGYFIATNYSGASDDAKVQNAINACQTAGGGVVYIPPGSYTWTGGVSITAGGVIIQGGGKGATKINVSPSATFDAVTINTSGYPSENSFGSGVVDLTIQKTSGATAAGCGIKILNSGSAHCRDVHIYNFATGFFTENTYCSFHERIVCFVTGATVNVTGFEIYSANPAEASDSIRFESCVFAGYFTGRSGVSSGTVKGWYLHGASIQDIFLFNCEGDDATYGLEIDGSAVTGGTGSGGFDVHVCNFIADFCDSYGIYAHGNVTGNNAAIDINGGECSLCSVGVMVSGCDQVIVRGMQILVPVGAGGIEFSSSAYCSASQNLILGGQTSGFGIASVSSTNIGCVGNVVRYAATAYSGSFTNAAGNVP